MNNNLRTTEIQEFLDKTGWGEAARTPLNADASTRRYERLVLPGRRAVLMDAPPSAESASGDTPNAASPSTTR